jgi:hypothetical protein
MNGRESKWEAEVIDGEMRGGTMQAQTTSLSGQEVRLPKEEVVLHGPTSSPRKKHYTSNLSVDSTFCTLRHDLNKTTSRSPSLAPSYGNVKLPNSRSSARAILPLIRSINMLHSTTTRYPSACKYQAACPPSYERPLLMVRRPCVTVER